MGVMLKNIFQGILLHLSLLYAGWCYRVRVLLIHMRQRCRCVISGRIYSDKVNYCLLYFSPAQALKIERLCGAFIYLSFRAYARNLSLSSRTRRRRREGSHVFARLVGDSSFRLRYVQNDNRVIPNRDLWSSVRNLPLLTRNGGDYTLA